MYVCVYECNRREGHKKPFLRKAKAGYDIATSWSPTFEVCVHITSIHIVESI